MVEHISEILPASGLIHIGELATWFNMEPTNLVNALRKRKIPILDIGNKLYWAVRLEDVKGV